MIWQTRLQEEGGERWPRGFGWLGWWGVPTTSVVDFGFLSDIKVGFLHSYAKAGASLSERSRTVTDGRPRIDMSKSGRFFPHPSLPYPAFSIADATCPLGCQLDEASDTKSACMALLRRSFTRGVLWTSHAMQAGIHFCRFSRTGNTRVGGTARAKQRGTEHTDQVELELYLRYSPEDMYRYNSTPDSIKKSAHIFDMSPTAGFLRTPSLLPVKSTDTLGQG